MSGRLPDDESDDVPDPVPIWRRRNVQIAGVAGVVLLAFLFTRGKPRHAEQKSAQDQYIAAVVPYAPVTTPKLTPVAASIPRPASAPIPVQLTQPPAPPSFRTAEVLPAGVAKPTRPMLSFPVPPKADTPAPAATRSSGPARTGLAFKASSVPGIKASPAIDDTYQLMPGLLPCVLDTAIQSDLPGPLMCHLPGPVYSPRGVLLMEAETQVIGRYESMGKSGESRLMAVSTYAHTPNGIWVPLADDPMSDDLGRDGLDGAVNNHYLRRFGGAVLLSLTQGALGILQAEVSKGGNSYVQVSSGDGVGGLAEQILQSQVNIVPTFEKHQGETIAIWLTAPIDFSDSYRVRAAR
jgi:type IV secretion system protein VirB10